VALASAASRRGGARQIGIERAVDAMPARGQVRVQSRGAGALRVAVALRNAPAGARVHFSDATGRVARSVEATEISAAGRSWGAYWGPVTSGPEQWVQLEMPAGMTASEGMLVVRSVSHLVDDPVLALQPASAAKSSGSCERDVSCGAQADEALAKAARSVAKIVYTIDGASFACTGTLVNSMGTVQVPFVLTARHCIDSEAAAATVNTFWFLEASTCGAKSAPGAVQLSGGATLSYAGAVSDVALIRLNEPAPAGAWFSGIDASALAAHDSAITVHHPLGDLKKLSSGLVVEPSAGATMMSVAWLSGSTEPGSSGSGLFTAREDQYLLRGTLRGGSASCANSGSLDDAANRDYYARLDADSAAIEKLMKAASGPAENFTDIWSSLTEPGTGLSITHRAGTNAMFVVSFTYSPQGRASWIVVQGGAWQSPTVFEGPAYRATRAGTVVTQAPIGTVTLTFDNGQVTMRSRLDGMPERVGVFQRYAF
jgi:hypothetical protein